MIEPMPFGKRMVDPRAGRSDEYWQQARSEVEAEEAEAGNKSPDNGTEKRQTPPAGSN